MRKENCKILIIYIALCLLLTGCGCKHEWLDATCTAPFTCVLCGKMRGSPISHQWEEATCETAKTCALCGQIDGEARGHAWMETEREPGKYCRNCPARITYERLYLNENITCGSLEFTITDVRIKDSFTAGEYYYFPINSSDCCLTVSVTIKNTSAETRTVGCDGFSVHHGSSIHNCSELIYSPEHRDIYAYGGKMTRDHIEIAGGATQYALISFIVPGDIKDSSKSVWIDFDEEALGAEEINSVYIVRPIDDIQKEAYYQQAQTLMAENNFKRAVELLEEMDDTQSELYHTCIRYWIIQDGIDGGNKTTYANEHFDEFERLTGKKLKELMVGDWYLSKYDHHEYSFTQSGKILADGELKGTWSVKDNSLIFRYYYAEDMFSDYELSFLRICENGYIATMEDDTVFFGSFYDLDMIQN